MLVVEEIIELIIKLYEKIIAKGTESFSFDYLKAAALVFKSIDDELLIITDSNPCLSYGNN